MNGPSLQDLGPRVWQRDPRGTQGVTWPNGERDPSVCVWGGEAGCVLRSPFPTRAWGRRFLPRCLPPAAPRPRVAGPFPARSLPRAPQPEPGSAGGSSGSRATGKARKLSEQLRPARLLRAKEPSPALHPRQLEHLRRPQGVCAVGGGGGGGGLGSPASCTDVCL